MKNCLSKIRLLFPLFILFLFMLSPLGAQAGISSTKKKSGHHHSHKKVKKQQKPKYEDINLISDFDEEEEDEEDDDEQVSIHSSQKRNHEFQNYQYKGDSQLGRYWGLQHGLTEYPTHCYFYLSPSLLQIRVLRI